MNNKLKLGTLILLLLTLLTNLSFSQSDRKFPSAKERTSSLVEQLKTELLLTEKQISLVREIALKYANKIEELRNNSTDRGEMMSSIQSIKEDQNKEMKKVLTKEQFKKYENIQEENRTRMMRRR